MSLEYTKKGKIGILIIVVWFIVSGILTLGGIILMQMHTQDILNANMDQVTFDYWIAVGGLISLMVGSTIIFGFTGMSSHLDWYEWKP